LDRGDDAGGGASIDDDVIALGCSEAQGEETEEG